MTRKTAFISFSPRALLAILVIYSWLCPVFRVQAQNSAYSFSSSDSRIGGPDGDKDLDTNAGSPSTNFAYKTQFALSAAILSIDLTAIGLLPTKGSGNTAYQYDLPTVEDPTRINQANGSDVNDPFGGNDGLNQAVVVHSLAVSGSGGTPGTPLSRSRQAYP